MNIIDFTSGAEISPKKKKQTKKDRSLNIIVLAFI